MDFSITFLQLLLRAVYLVSPLLILLCLVIMALGLIVGRIESWKKFDALYWAFITALTVGYGDIRPLRKLSKFFSVVVAWIGIMVSGLFVAVTVKTASSAFEMHADPILLQHINRQFM